MGYALRMSGEMHDWLTDLRDSDPPAARRVGEALTALMSGDASLEPPLVVPVAHGAWPLRLTEMLDRSYQRGLEWTQAARIRAAQAATVAQRVRAQIASLEALPAGQQADTPNQLDALRERLVEVTRTEKKLTEDSQRRAQKLDAFSTRKQVLQAIYTAAQAEVAVPEAFAAAGPDAPKPDDAGPDGTGPDGTGPDGTGPDGTGRSTHDEERGAAADKLRETEEDIERELNAAPWAEASGDLRPQPGLMELRPGAPDTDDLSILFAVEPPGTALLLAVLEGRDARREHYDEAVSLSSEVLRHVRDGQAPEAAAHAFGDVPSFLDEFFAGQALEVEAGAAALTARNRARTLAELRDRLGLSQAQVASQLGVRESRVAAIERAEPGATEVRALAGYVEALGGRLEIIADVGGERVVLR